VNEKFAGKQGPCPKCKKTITIPKLDEQVVVHEPEAYGGAKDAKGQSVLKPISREETKVKPAAVAGIVGAIVMAFIVAFVLRKSPDVKSNPIVLGAAAVLLAPAMVVAGYSFLRNQELEPYRGGELMVRTAICAAVYAALWGGIWALKHFLVGDAGGTEAWNVLMVIAVVAPPVIIGALTALGTLDLDFGSGALHYVLYLGVCVLLRLTAGMKFL
jgi:cation transport ATPase